MNNIINRCGATGAVVDGAAYGLDYETLNFISKFNRKSEF